MAVNLKISYRSEKEKKQEYKIDFDCFCKFFMEEFKFIMDYVMVNSW